VAQLKSGGDVKGGVNELELLAIQAEGSFDERGRLAGLYGVTVVCAGPGQALWIGADVPDALAGELTTTFARAPAATAAIDAGTPPPALALCQRLLERDGRPLPTRGGALSSMRKRGPPQSRVHIERSDTTRAEILRNANPGNWQPLEWNELLDGRLGPWTMAIEDELVVSICHTPRPLSARAAECGVWTRPGFRGRGYAAAVTSAWAELIRPSGRHRFYSTEHDNFSSQNVARRLQLRLLGWTWRLGRAREDEDPRVHPLSSLRRP
jgi:RimJ/RimL family protein N-acetyltransferase